MILRGNRPRGYTLVELSVVLVIAGVLALIGIAYFSDPGPSSVRAIMDDLEGTLLSAQQLAVATSQDVTVAAQGNWSPAAPLVLAFQQNPGNALTAAQVIANNLNAASTFKLALNPGGGSIARVHASAGVVAAAGTGATWWQDAMRASPVNGKANADLSQLEPFKDQAGFQNLIGTQTANLFQGAATNQVTISGVNKRFGSTFWVAVVATRGGAAVNGGAMGLLVVLANGATVFKFYNPGVGNGDGSWRRM
jgi:prepilin-type N-terminal cleavage/methylation domain-containing protein